MNEVNNEDIIMTSDADMLPLSDYWQPNAADITVYGHDLTGHQQVPMCYVAMTKANWLKVMNLAPMSYSLAHYLRRDLADTNALSTVQHEWWVVDQDILTDRLSKHQVVNVLRGIEPNSYLPLGRMDRANMKQYPQTLIDFHGPRKGWEHLPKIKEILLKAFGELPEWFDKMYEVRK
jgi:hypothetical protein